MDKHILFGNSSSTDLSNWDYLKRAHIHSLLEESLKKPVVTVIAGAGYGKTQAVYSFLKDYSATTIWLPLTALDNISERYWVNFINAYSLVNKTAATDLEILGFPDTVVKFDRFLSYMLRTMTPGAKYAIVYDDFHLLHEKKVLQHIEKLINANIPNFSIILISRSEPEINTVGLISKDRLSNICEEELRFSERDMSSYFEMQGIRISPQNVSKIYKNTDGWIMAIRMVELSIKKGVPHEEYALTAMKINIFRLMENEVFSTVAEETKTFLIKLSLFNSLPLELVELLSANDKQLVNAILKINSFIRYDSFSNMYCIHHLFLDFLKKKQDILTQNEKLEYYRIAADWYALNGYKIDAITYYEKAGDYGKILKIALIFPHASSEEAALVLDILKRAPEEVYKQDPLLGILRIRALNMVGRMQEATDELDMLVKRYEGLPQTLEYRSVLCEMYIVEALNTYYFSVVSNNFSFPDSFIKAYECTKEGVVLKVRYNAQEVGPYVCRIGSYKKEDMERYISAVNIAAHYAPKVMNGCMCGLDDLALAELEYFKNNMRTSEKLAYQAFYKSREKQQHSIEIRALFYLLRIYISAGDFIKIQDLIRYIDLQKEIENSLNSQTLYDIVTGWFYSIIGQNSEVAVWIKSSFEQGDLIIFASGVENLVKIKYHLSEKKYYELLAFLEGQENEYGINATNSFLFGKIALLATKAVCLYHIKEQVRALKSLQDAYYLAEPNSLTMQFIELGNNMVSLAKFALKSSDCTVPKEWLKDILRKSSTYAKRLSHISLEYKRMNHLEFDLQYKLTKKESEFLNDICHGMTKAEIAASRDVSLSYVKNRLETIYFKLGAKNTKDAIRIASLMEMVK